MLVQDFSMVDGRFEAVEVSPLGPDQTVLTILGAIAVLPAGSRARIGSGTGPDVAERLATTQVLLSIEPGSPESTDAWRSFLSKMTGRGLREPLLVISDGGAGLIAAVELVLSSSERLRCLVCRERNVLAKVPRDARAQVKTDYWAIWSRIDEEAEEAAVAEARRHRIRHSDFIERTFAETRRRVKVIGRLPGERTRALEGR